MRKSIICKAFLFIMLFSLMVSCGIGTGQEDKTEGVPSENQVGSEMPGVGDSVGNPYNAVLSVIKAKSATDAVVEDYSQNVFRDIDSDGKEELLLTYVDKQESHVRYEVWTCPNGELDLITEGDLLSIAGTPRGGIGQITYEENPYLCIYSSNGEMGNNGMEYYGTITFHRLSNGTIEDSTFMSFFFTGDDCWTPDGEVIEADIGGEPASHEDLVALFALLQESPMINFG